MNIASPWKAPACTQRVLENRLKQIEEPELRAFETERFLATRCGAKTRPQRGGRPCRRKALRNGRCRNHGGMSTGPRTPKGRARALANLRQNRSRIAAETAPQLD